MYEDYFKLKIKPFALNPDPAFFYGSKEHNRVLAYLRYGISQEEGFIAVTGDVGTGKTTLVSTLREELSKNKKIVCSYIVTTQLEPEDLLRMVAGSYGLKFEGLSKSALLQNIESYLLKQVKAGKRVLLVVDEAQNLSPHSLEELRMLSNYHLNNKILLQSFLMGQAEFRDTLRMPELEQFRQRIIASYHLGPLSQQDTKGYIDHRLKVSGWKGDPYFSANAYKVIYEASHGVPRRINTLCDRIFLYAFTEEKHEINSELVNEVLDELDEEIHFEKKDGVQVSEQNQISSDERGDSGGRIAQLEDRVERLEEMLMSARKLIQSIMLD